jgi:Zn-dependent peptidase ImmA (M78 family)
MNVQVRPKLLEWARERASLDPAELATMVGTKAKPAPIEEWEKTGELPLKKLEVLAAKVHVPLGYLFLEEPPEEPLPLPDFRTVDGNEVKRPSPELIDTVYACVRRQDWFRDYLEDIGGEPLPFVGQFNVNSDTNIVAANIRDVVGWTPEERAAEQNLQQVVGRLAARIEEVGVLVMRNGVVGNNTHRPLNPEEFRGFALFDPLAPLIFVNAADAAVAQLFTLAHELAHIWIGQSALDDGRIVTDQPIERFCNQVAAEVLVPMEEFQAEWSGLNGGPDELRRLSLRFRVSRYVILIRAFEGGLIDRETLDARYEGERSRPFRAGSDSGGGNFYYTQRSRLGRRFAQAVIRSARTGQTLMREAYELLGVTKHETFVRLAESMEVQV